MFSQSDLSTFPGDGSISRTNVTKIFLAGARGVNGSTHVIATREMRVQIPPDSLQNRFSAVEDLASRSIFG